LRPPRWNSGAEIAEVAVAVGTLAEGGDGVVETFAGGAGDAVTMRLIPQSISLKPRVS